MNQTRFPKIEYRLKELVLREAQTADAPASLDTTGELVVSGVTNQVTMPVTIESPAKGRMKVKGSVTLKMTGFGITPPRPKFLPWLKVGDEVRIIFEWLITEQTAVARSFSAGQGGPEPDGGAGRAEGLRGQQSQR